MNQPSSAETPAWFVRRTTEGLRFLLINPTIVDKREHMHIGLATVGSYVKQRSRHSVRILDFMAFRRTWRERLQQVLTDYKPDVIGMYISSPYWAAARSVAQEVKRHMPQVPILAGGHHPTLAPDEVMEARLFDMLLIGEGEKPTVTFLNTLAAGAPLDEVPGLWWRENGAIRKTDKETLIESEEMPTVDWSLHDEETLRANFYYWGILPVMASRGCPARCSFCSITQVQKMYSGEKFLRFRDPKKVVDEIEADYERYKDMGLRVIYFYDLNFLVNPRWLKQFTDEYKSRGLNTKLKWSAYTRADHVVPSTIESLRDSGCVNLRVGIEAANPYMRNVLYEKEVSQEVLEEALRQIKSIGITITCYFMAGGPGERPEWLQESLELSKRFGVEFPVFFHYKPLAGTSILDRVEELGSELLVESLDSNADFLHGVNMSHEYIKAWQLKFFVLMTQVAFGPNLVFGHMKQAGWRYVPRVARYLTKAMADGFTPYGALTYFIFYGYDHFIDMPVIPAEEKPGLGWRAFSKFTERVLGRSGAPAPDWKPTPRRGPAAKTSILKVKEAEAPLPGGALTSLGVGRSSEVKH